MNTPVVLVAYGSRSGGTAGLAEMITKSLIEAGVEAHCWQGRRVRTVEQYDAVILGGALYAGRWHREARAFARRFGSALQGRPVWLFSSGPLDDSADTKDIPPVPQAALAATRLHAISHTTFGGYLAPDARGFIARAMVKQGRGGDFRNAKRIDAWAREIASFLHRNLAAKGTNATGSAS